MSEFCPPTDLEYVTLEGSSLTATEGSCAEIKCLFKYHDVDGNSRWFWIKDAKWETNYQNFSGSILYSSPNSLNTVSEDYATRVKYTGSLFSRWNSQWTQKCNILICNLTKEDNGNYSFRFEGKIKWITNEIKISVRGQ